MIADRPLTVLPWTPTPKQEEAIRLLGLHPTKAPDPIGPVEELLFGGAAGPGKTGLLLILMAMLPQIAPHSRTLVVRETYPNLWETIIEPFLGLVPEWFGMYNEKRHEFTAANGARIFFRAAEDEATVYRKFRGPQYEFELFDESTELSEGSIKFIGSRNRSTQPGWRPFKVYATNPVGPSHQYFLETFVDAGIPGKPFLAPPPKGSTRPIVRCFLPGLLEDNEHWTDMDAVAGGIEIIHDPIIAAAQRTGNWHLNMGTFFKQFRYDIHVRELPPSAYEDWPRSRSLDYGLDWGYCLWAARIHDRGVPRTHIYRELVMHDLPAQLQARQITAYSRADPRIRETLAGHDQNRRTGAGKHAGVRLKDEYLAGGVRIVVANSDRRGGWDRVHRALYYAQNLGQPPELSIDPSCVELIKEFRNAQRDPVKQWDMRQPQNPTDSRDDALEALRLLLMGAARTDTQSRAVKHYNVKVD